MSEFVLFMPENFNEDEEPSDDILWQVKYKLHGDGFTANVYLYDIINQDITDTFTLEAVETNMYEMGLEKVFDFPFAKEYVFEDDFGILFSATATALDLHGFENKLKINKKFAKIIFDDLKLPLQGKMHPEKFLRLLGKSIDFSEEKYEQYDKNFDLLLELENICNRCLQYETNIEWKIINEVMK